MPGKRNGALLSPLAPTGVYQRIPVSDLLFDLKNPRLAEFGIPDNASQLDVLKTLWQHMAIEEIAMSIAHNGYFEHEPLFVEQADRQKYVVIEGNRRLAAVKLLLDADLRNRLRAFDLPTITAERRREIADLPIIITTRRDS
jgi:hypothetical protein